MSIDNLTIGEAREIAAMFGGSGKATDLYSRYIGKYVIVRSRNEGVNAGKVVMADETGVVLADARRLYYHKPADKSQSWYEGVANTGLGSGSKVSAPVAEKAIIEDYSITICAPSAEVSIREWDSHEQS